ncbi:hypothetical protein [Clostridium sp. OS1-26]|uniref:hypothetical protein n=1 Tax=Clostridium sp. OS1-26 TaxID=3070681 RepID=UPI0027E08EE4|nr:hypothetical protein [Clostridium sp. OS1-26]WML34836.1 hypothetical protein RCG18_26895 [Clostridium sp. OS1-26]
MQNLILTPTGFTNKNIVHAEEGTECGYLNTSDCPNIKLTDNQAIIITDNDIAIIE